MAMKLMQYDMDIAYRKGAANGNADGLSNWTRLKKWWDHWQAQM